MTRTRLGSAKLLLALAVALAICVPPALSAGGSSAVERRYIVAFEESVDHPAVVARAQTEQRDGRLGFVYSHALKGYSVTLTEAAAEALKHDPRVSSVELDQLRAPGVQTTPTGVTRVFATQNSSADIDGSDDVKVNADVAVIDSGVDSKHPDLNVFKRTDCSNGEKAKATCVNESGTANEHGTHVAGTVGALDDGEGVVGAAPGVRIWGVKVLGTGENWESEEVAGIDWVTSKAAEIEVANMSIYCPGGLPCNEETEAWKKAIAKSVEAGVVYVTISGNNAGDASKSVYGTHPDLITVSAIADYNGEPGGGSKPTGCTEDGADDTFATFSNYGKDVEIAAPGVCINSTFPSVVEGEKTVGKYGVLSGTSMAAPLVSGAAAILASVSNPENKKDVEEIRKQLLNTGNYNWEDTSNDGVQEPLLDMGSLTGHGQWLINGATLAAGSETVTGEQEGASFFAVPNLGLGIECEKGKITNGKIEASGHGAATLSFTECWVLTESKLGAGKISKAICSAKNIEGKALALLTRHGGPFAIFTPAEGEAFATVKITGEKCAIAIEAPLTGSFAARIGPEAVKTTLEAIKGPALKKALGVELFFAEEPTDLHVKAFATLSGKEAGKKWGAY